MLIKGSDHHTVIPMILMKHRVKVVFVLLAVVIYTVLIFFIGGAAYKDGIFGKVIKPIIEENIRIPFNWIRSFNVNPEHLKIDIKHKDFQKLAYKREVALSKGVLLSKPEDIVSAKIRWRGKNVKASIRLKGDLADHWADKTKWSFRLKTKGDEAIMGMKKFSLQHPRTRGFFNDWYLHKFLKKLGGFAVLRYEFVKFTLNGKYLGIYLLEEHFDEMLLQNNQFIDSPIIRIRDHLLWYNVDPVFGFTGAHLNEHYTLSPIDAFNTGTINQNKTLLMNFNQSKNLLESFRRGDLLTHQVFEVDKLAKLFALIDLFGYHHSTAYSNIRFYYNPITSLLEPIGYDNTFIFEAVSIQSQNVKLSDMPPQKPEFIDHDVYQKWYNTFFADLIFYRKYLEALEAISDKNFLDNFFLETDKEFQKELAIVYKTFPGYRFKFKPVFYRNQEYIRNILNPEQGIYAYYNKFNSNKNSLILELGNIQSLPVEILHASYNDGIFNSQNKEDVLMPKVQFEFVDYNKFEFKIPDGMLWNDDYKNRLFVQYRIFGRNDIREVKVFPWSNFDDNFLNNDFIRQKTKFRNSPFLVVDDPANKILIKPGKWNIDTSIIIPKGFKVICGAGTQLMLSNGAKILSYSPMQFIGTQQKPIIIQSKDFTGQGLVVIGADSKTIFKYVVFRDLKSPSQGDWRVPGALTFYESNLILSHCQFEGCKGENTVSVIRSEYTIDKCYFNNSQGNAFNVIYGKGKITNSSFTNCDSSGLVFKGSVLDADNIVLKNIKNCAISVGESCTSNLRNIEIENCKIAIENTDLSVMTIENIKLDNCEIGIAVFQKHNESGPAKVVVTHHEFKNTKTDYLLERGSTLTINNSYVKPNRNKVNSALLGK